MINNIYFAVLASILPFNALRKFFYCKILKYKIDKKSYLGFLTILHSKECKIFNSKVKSFNFINSKKIEIINSNIKKFNRIKNLNHFYFENSIIGNSNTIYGNKVLNEKSNFLVNKNCTIENFNFFDLNDTIKLQENCIISSHCNFWTHGFDGKREKMQTGSITIFNNVKIEACVTLINSITIQNNSTIKFGSIVHKSLLESGVYSSNEIFKKI